MNAEIITIGDELLIGQVINTNASHIGGLLHENGIHINRMTSVGDDESQIRESFHAAWMVQDIVISTGGLGPTHDDITRKVITEFFNTRLILNADVMNDVRLFFEKRQRSVKKINRDQALVPETAQIIRNEHGTAPGFIFQRGAKTFFVLPGVPHEMKAMMDTTVIPYLRQNQNSFTKSRTLLTTGIFESSLSLLLSGLAESMEKNSLAFLPSSTGVRIRVTAKARHQPEADLFLDEICKQIYASIGDYIYGEGRIELEEVVGQMFIERRLTLAVAESCTGGLIGHKITNVPGSSKYFLRDIVAYSNDTKTALLNIPEKSINSHGAVSPETARIMAEHVRKMSGASIGISTTGIAGPGGGSESKPAGLVWIGYSDEEKTDSYKFFFGDHRIQVKERAAQTALEIIRRKLLGLPIKLY